MQMNQTVMLFFLVDGCLCVIAAAIFYIRTQKKMKNSFEADAVVTDILHETSSGSGEMIYPVFEFRVGSETYKAKNRYGKNPWNISKGESVRILYSADNPEDAEIKNTFMLWMFPLFFACGALMAFITAPALYFILKNSGT